MSVSSLGETPGPVRERDIVADWIGHNDSATLVIKLRLNADHTGVIYYSRAPKEVRVYAIEKWDLDKNKLTIKHKGNDRSFVVTHVSSRIIRVRVMEGIHRSVYELFREDRMNEHLTAINDVQNADGEAKAH